MNSTFSASLIERLMGIAIVVAILAFIGLVGLVDSFQFGLSTLSRLSTAVTIATLFCAGIVRWWWKYPPFAIYLKVPVLEGTWTGHLESNWTLAAGSVSRPLPIVFVIRQTLLGLSIRSFTSDKQGLSVSANILRHAEADLTKVAYIYSLSEEFRAGQGPQQGAAEVCLIIGSAYRFHGEYWTNTQTRGRLVLQRQIREFVSSFADATGRWNADTWCKF